MRFVFYTNSISAHQLPLARELVTRLGEDNYRYVFTGESLQGGAQEITAPEPWVVQIRTDQDRTDLLENCEILLSGVRDIDLFVRRANRGLTSFYTSERWFKPIVKSICGLKLRFYLPGKLRMLWPGYRRMAKRFVYWLKTDPHARYFAIGPWAKKDMIGLGVPKSKIVDWGYFVESSHDTKETTQRIPKASPIRILWVGRLLDWKRVDTIIRAVVRANNMVKSDKGGIRHKFLLTLVGEGPEKERMRKLASVLSFGLPSFVEFSHSAPISQVRKLMRDHDIYVLSSDAQEGWGAALSEAMTEGMACLGTYEAGASAALLPDTHLFKTGDYKRLAALLVKVSNQIQTAKIKLPDAYLPQGAAEKLMRLI